MKDPYIYSETNVLVNLLSIQDSEILEKAEAEYTAYRLSGLVTDTTMKLFDFSLLCHIHYQIFQDIYEWAGKPRIINIEKSERALGGLSIEYSDCFDIKRDADAILYAMNHYDWNKASFQDVIKSFSSFMAGLWKVHPFREGNTRTVVTFCNKFIESKGYSINQELLADNAEYLRTALVAANAIFSDIGDKRKPEYLERIVSDALKVPKTSILNKLNENKTLLSKKRHEEKPYIKGKEDREK